MLASGSRPKKSWVALHLDRQGAFAVESVHASHRPARVSRRRIGDPAVDANPAELFGVTGMSVDRAWQVTTGRPDVTIAVLDSGIKWNDVGAMSDLRRKVRLNKGELPKPRHSGGSDCAAYDCNGDGVFNVDDYAQDPRISLSDPRRVGPAGVLVPQDLLIAFSNGSDSDHNGFVDDIAGWDFLDNDNDPFDDVQYGQGKGAAKDSS